MPYGVYSLLGRQALNKRANVSVIAALNERKEQEMTLSGNWGGVTLRVLRENLSLLTWRMLKR